MRKLLIIALLSFAISPVISQTADNVELDESRWNESDWYGWYNDTHAPDILHEEHGWQIWIESGPADLLVFDYGLNSYFWTARSIYPLVYLFNTAHGWLLYDDSAQDPERWFYEPFSKEWITDQSLTVSVPVEPDPDVLQKLRDGRLNPLDSLPPELSETLYGKQASPSNPETHQDPLFALVPPGTFLMGSPRTEPFRAWTEHLHVVTLTRPYLVHRTEVTNAQMAEVLNWALEHGMVGVTDDGVHNLVGEPRKLLELNRKHCQIEWTGRVFTAVPGKEHYPCIEVTWYGAMTYCYLKTEMEGGLQQAVDMDEWTINLQANGYRLPTEAEWEYACRAKSATPVHDEELPANGKVAADSLISKMGWFLENSFSDDAPMSLGRSSQPVGTKLPNAWGLHDMHGNVWEWCYDKFDAYPAGNVIDPTGPEKGIFRVGRGGAWSNPVQFTRSAIRSYPSPSRGAYHWGFRPVRTATQ